MWPHIADTLVLAREHGFGVYLQVIQAQGNGMRLISLPPPPAIVPLLVILVLGAHPFNASGQAILGTIRDSTTDRSLPGAHVALLDFAGDTVATTVSGPDGKFMMASPDWGEFAISMIRLGYQPLAGFLSLTPGDTLSLTYRMHPLAVMMDPVVILAEAAVQLGYVRHLQREGFYHRARVTSGHHLDPVAVETHRKFANRIRDYLVGLPRARMVEGSLGSGRYLRLGCGRPRYFLDDRLILFRQEIDEWVQPLDVLAIEIYDGAAISDARYGSCAVVVWTRHKAEQQSIPR